MVNSHLFGHGLSCVDVIHTSSDLYFHMYVGKYCDNENSWFRDFDTFIYFQVYHQENNGMPSSGPNAYMRQYVQYLCTEHECK
jgi:hypothetical protein